MIDMYHPAPGGKMPEGGTDFADETIECDRCGAPATRSWEGKEFLQLCDGCHDALGRDVAELEAE